MVMAQVQEKEFNLSNLICHVYYTTAPIFATKNTMVFLVPVMF